MTSSAVKTVNAGARVAGRGAALQMNINAGKALQDIIKTNLGPKGTMKMLVSGSGDIRLTKDGSILIKQMQIKHPTASLIARNATAQDKLTGDGTTSNIILVGELLKQCEQYLVEGQHPRILAEGLDLAKTVALDFLDKFSITPKVVDKALLRKVARTCCRTKLEPKLADKIADICVDAVLTVQQPDQQIDLHMVERMQMQQLSAYDTEFVSGLVLDHGSRNPKMPKRMENCFILICNVSLEYEKTELNSGFIYKDAQSREALVASERQHVEDRCRQIIALKEKVVGNDKTKSFCVINQKGIDPGCLEMLANAGISGIRRAKRRNMARLTLACGGRPVNHTHDLNESVLGWAGLIYERQLGDEKFTFIQKVKNPHSCTILMRGPNKHTLSLVNDTVHDGLRAVKNVMEDKRIVPGAGSFEISCSEEILKASRKARGRVRLGMNAFAKALLIIPKVLATNAGYDPQNSIISVQDALLDSNGKQPVGLDLETGEAFNPVDHGIYDNYAVKRLLLSSTTIIATQILLVDEIFRVNPK